MDESDIKPWPIFDEQEMAAAASVLRSGRVNYWTGEEGRRFEAEFAGMLGARHAVALSSGTAALETALHSLQIGPGDEVIVTPRTFIATVSSIVFCGATPVFADVDRDSQNITAETIRRALTPRAKAVAAVHLNGWPCDMDPIMELASEAGLTVIEDCAQSLGAKYKGRPAGTLGHVAAFSFCQDKILTTAGEGGMLATNDAELWEKAWAFKDHGKSYDAVYRRRHPPGFRWLHETIGSNRRMTEIQAAVGRIGLRKLSARVEACRAKAARLDRCFETLPGLRVTRPPGEVRHSYYRHSVFIEPGKLAAGWSRDRILQALSEEGLAGQTGSCGEVYLEKAFKDLGLRPVEPLPTARELSETSLAFPVHPGVGDGHLSRVEEAMERVMNRACAAPGWGS